MELNVKIVEIDMWEKPQEMATLEAFSMSKMQNQIIKRKEKNLYY